MRRYWVPPGCIDLKKRQIFLKDDIFHHVVRVCRQTTGSRFEVLTQKNLAYFVCLTQVGSKEARAEILEERKIPQLKKPFIHLALSLPQLKKIDEILPKATELGVKEVVLFTSDFSFQKKSLDFFSKKQTRWNKIILSAMEQSGRGDPMVLSGPLTFYELLKKFKERKNAMGLFAYEGESQMRAKEYLEGLTKNGKDFEESWLFVGSEGGFSPQEVEVFKESGLTPITLGDQILRVETACVVLPTILKYQWDL